MRPPTGRVTCVHVLMLSCLRCLGQSYEVQHRAP